MLNEQQQRAVRYDGEADALLLLAGAGSGKTHTLTERIVYLVNEENISPKRILAITFTRKAANEMRERLQSKVDNASQLGCGTFHAFCLSVIRAFPKTFNLKGFTIIDTDDQIDIMRLSKGACAGRNFPVRERDLISIYSMYRNTGQELDGYIREFRPEVESQIGKLHEIFEDYETRKKTRQYIDYDDILFLFEAKLRENDRFRDKISNAYDYILVDEMQDTNHLQWSIVSQLKNPAKLFCVGDDSQSIYAFRGADYRNVHDFINRISNSKVLKLETNYRSTQEILDLSNWLLAESSLNYDKHLVSHLGSGHRPEFLEFNSEEEETRWMINDIVQRANSGQTDLRDIMILIRSVRSRGAKLIQQYMAASGIPFQVFGGQGFANAAHIKDYTSMLRACRSSKDQVAWSRYLKLWPGIGSQKASRVVDSIIHEKDMNAAFDITDTMLKATRITAPLRTAFSNIRNPGKAISATFGMMSDVLEQHYSKRDGWDIRKSDLDILKSTAGNFSSLSDLIDAFVLDPTSGNDASKFEDNKVTLSTVHSAKGLESDVVYISRCQPGHFPSRMSKTPDEIEEERRVLYVAITRAKSYLYLTSVRDGFGHDEEYATDFLERIPPGILTFKSSWRMDEEQDSRDAWF